METEMVKVTWIGGAPDCDHRSIEAPGECAWCGARQSETPAPAPSMDLHKLLTWDQLNALDIALEQETIRLRAFRNTGYCRGGGAGPKHRAFWQERIDALGQVRQVLGLPALGPDPDEVGP